MPPIESPPTIEPKPAPKPRRRWWNLSVRGLMLLVLVVGGGIGWEVQRVDRLRGAVAVLRRKVEGLPDEPDRMVAIQIKRNALAGGSRVQILFDDEPTSFIPVRLARPGDKASWLRRVVGEDHFRRVTAIRFNRRPSAEDWDAIKTLGSVERLGFASSQVTDESLVRLPDCGTLRDLDLAGSPITDKTLAVVGTLPGLRSLNLERTNTSNDGLASLRGQTGLEELNLNTRIDANAGLVHFQGRTNFRSLSVGGLSDEGLRLIAGNQQLESLSFSASHITDQGWAIVVGFRNLKELQILGGRAIRLRVRPGLRTMEQPIELTPAAIQSLGQLTRQEKLTLGDFANNLWLGAVGRLPQLRNLTLFGDGFTDHGLIPVGQLATLETLSIFGGNIDDAGVKNLAPLRRLRFLTLYGQVSDEAIAELRTAIPTLKYVHNGKTPAKPAPSKPKP